MAVSNCNAVGARLLLGLALLAVTYGMLTPTPPPLPGFEQSDKLVHFLAFLTLSALADIGWPQRGFDLRKFLPLLVYAGAVEGLQHFVPGRDLSAWDLLANVLGIAAYAWLAMPLLRRMALR